MAPTQIPTPGSLDEMRRQARELHAAGRIQDAIQMQIAVLNAARSAGASETLDFHRLGLMLFTSKDFPAAAKAFEEVVRRDPDYPGISQNLGLSLILCDRLPEAIAALHRAAEISPHELPVLDGLAHAYGKSGDFENARIYGEQSLLAKDARAQQPPAGFAIPNTVPPRFRIDHPQENVISFSLFGGQARYVRGAVKNAIIAIGLYPGWKCRYYCDETVPEAARKELVEAGAEVILRPRAKNPTEGLFWRFLVADDPAVVRFIVRDCDSLMNIRERRAVDEWINSDYWFHTLRDNAAHTDLLLAGLWGGIARVLPPLPQLLSGFSYNPITDSRSADQLFLGRIVWPMIKSSCLIHDRVYRVFGARPFPPGAELPRERHVGANDAALNL